MEIQFEFIKPRVILSDCQIDRIRVYNDKMLIIEFCDGFFAKYNDNSFYRVRDGVASFISDYSDFFDISIIKNYDKQYSELEHIELVGIDEYLNKNFSLIIVEEYYFSNNALFVAILKNDECRYKVIIRINFNKIVFSFDEYDLNKKY